MATAIPKNSVWSAMSYVPPKGKCNYKTSLMSPACPCLRFMLHPVKAATSFECDGCNHHASFHSMENPAEDAILKKWEEQEAQAASTHKQALAGASRKRKRIAEKPSEDERQVLLITDGAEDENLEAVMEVEEQIQSELVSTRKRRGKKTGV